MSDFEAYRLGLVESIGDDVLGNRVSLADLLEAAGEFSAAGWYRKGYYIGERLLAGLEVPV